MAFAAKAKIVTLFLNAQLAISLRIALTKMGHPQLATNIKTDNNTVDRFLNGTIKQNKRSKNEIRLAQMQISSTPIQHLLGPWTRKFCRLFHKKSLICSTQSYKTNLSGI